EECLQPRPSPEPLIRHIISMDLDQAKSFWRQSLRDCIPSRIAARKSDQATETSQTFRMEKATLIRFAQVQEFCKSLGITPQALGQACWALVLGQMIEKTDVLFGNVLWGRDFEDAEKVM